MQIFATVMASHRRHAQWTGLHVWFGIRWTPDVRYFYLREYNRDLFVCRHERRHDLSSL